MATEGKSYIDLRTNKRMLSAFASPNLIKNKLPEVNSPMKFTNVKKPEAGQQTFIDRNAKFLKDLSEQKAKKEAEIAVVKEAEERAKQDLKK